MRRRRRSRSGSAPAPEPSGAVSDLTILWRVLPDLWPAGQPRLRARVVVSVLLLVLAKGATLVIPFVYREAVDSLTPGEAAVIAAPVMLVVAYGVTRFMGTALQQLRDLVFAEVGQHALRQLGLRVFAHVHRLSLGYHISRRTGALSRIVDRGIKAIDFLLRYLLFSIVPLALELVVVAVIFWLEFGVWYAIVLAATFAVYTAFTFKVTEWRVAIRREMNDQDQDAFQKAVDSLLNYETVKYFSAEERETARYDGAMAAYQNAAVRTQSSLAVLNGGQALILTAATVAVMAMAAREVLAGGMSVGSFVMVNTFMIQITVPLNFLGSVYREIRQSLVDMREMYGLMAQDPGVEDTPGAPALAVERGEVRFEDVSFGYGPDRPILRGVSFTIPPGKTLAVVGPSGAGKSTIARLLFRFYDVDGGSISVDDQDVRGVSQESLRRAIGVVPQDTVLFNDSIGYNIAYGRDGATRAEVEAAAKAARIQEFIETLPDGYDTLVGERGLKLSGGEKQRVAIARTILKNPPVLILDEATSALDTTTEAEIQAELRRLGRGRTVLMIAHRLSTVVDADEIAVLEDGRIAERGSHERLLGLGGRYAQLWNRQAAEEAA
ncbi:MAG TPA: ABC transporter ATP-binding protein/permease [Paracoccaceae bacterium]|nr:ABC transporter ATP-binding protein/permease [Paracoccaceae bacterium]